MKKFKIKNILIFTAIGILLIAYSSFKASFSLEKESSKTVANLNEYINSLDNIIDITSFDNSYTSVVSFFDDRYISKLFNFKTGKEVSMDSIIKDECIDLFWDKVKELLYLKYPYFIASILDKHDKTNSFYLKENELIIYYYDYEINPMPNEEVLLHVNYNEIKDYLDITVKLDNTYVNEDGKKLNLNKKYIAITFDDGPSEYTLDLIDILNKNKASATFFMLGKNLSSYSDVVYKVYNSNFEIGYHSYNHKNFKRQTLKEIKDEFNKSNEILKSITGSSFSLIRPPYGSLTQSVKTSLDASFILWNIDTLDWKIKDSSYLVSYVLDNVEDGSIILFHDIHKTSIEAVDKLLPYLYVNDYQLLTVSDLAKINNTTLEKHKVYRYFEK